ncbi:hypothetical protein EMIT079MI2_130072 [Bacillus sp. IT-79MI2]
MGLKNNDLFYAWTDSLFHPKNDFELLVNKFGHSLDPYFPKDWDERLKLFKILFKQ